MRSESCVQFLNVRPKRRHIQIHSWLLCSLFFDGSWATIYSNVIAIPNFHCICQKAAACKVCPLVSQRNLNKTFIYKNEAFYEKHANIPSKCTFSAHADFSNGNFATSCEHIYIEIDAFRWKLLSQVFISLFLTAIKWMRNNDNRQKRSEKSPYCMFVKNNGLRKRWIKQKRWQFPKEKLNSTKILWNARDLLPNFLMHARTNDPFFVKWPSIVALGFETKSCRTDSFTDLNIKKWQNV